MDIACMSIRDERAEQSQPRKLYKPQRELGEMKPGVVVTWCDDGSHSTGGESDGELSTGG